MPIRPWKIIPSMYQRRLLLVAGGAVLMFTLPALQVLNLTVAKGGELRAEAEKRLVNQRWIRTIRGQIVDRKGRVLAVDRASFDIAVDYPVLTGKWAYTQAAARARRFNPHWNELAPEQREELVNKYLPEFQERIDRMWETLSMVSGVPRSDLELKRLQIIDQVRALAASVTEAQRKALEEELNKGEELSASEVDPSKRIEVRTNEVKRQIAEEATYHTVLADVPDAIGFRLRQLAEADGTPGDASDASALLPGVRMLDSVRREYPLETMDVDVDTRYLPGPLRHSGKQTVRVEGVATHVLGWVRERITADDITRRNAERLRRAGIEVPSVPEGLRGDDRAAAERAVNARIAELVRDLPSDAGQYFATDPVGASGIEYAGEFDLRGTRGVRTRHLDTEAVEVADPKHGRDVTLTLDIALQARIQALFDPSIGLAIAQPWHQARHDEQEPDHPQDIPLGTQLNGASVVIDIATGHILAMVSEPSFTRADLKQQPRAFWEDKYRTPLINRATFKWYTPGSIVKPLMLCAADAAGKLAHGERVDCTGHFFPDKPTKYRCWIYKQFHTTHTDRLGHEPNGAEAITGSCNIFFFEMGRRLGTQGVNEWYTKYGVGPRAERWNLGIGQESPGAIPRDPLKSSLDEAILMGIGQGPVAWTPLHAADAYATLARGGTRLIPRIRVDDPVCSEDLHLSSFATHQALDGLFGSANTKDGTTYTVKVPSASGEEHYERIFTIPGITVWAKSGTADVAPFKADLGLPGGPAVYDGDHAWCVALVGVGRPEYAIATVMDHGGSGGKCAGPVVNNIIAALVAEGYLPDLANHHTPSGSGDNDEDAGVTPLPRESDPALVHAQGADAHRE